MSKRIKIRPLVGEINQQTKLRLSKLLFDKIKLKFVKIVEAGDSFVVVCLNEDSVDLLISTKTIITLRNENFDIVMPPHLRARKCIVVRGIDSDIHEWTTEQIKDDLNNRNEWASVEEVYKMKNIKHMLKIRFTEISMARKACDQGLALYHTRIPSYQIEMEEFVQITPCWICYKYDHSSKECNLPELTFCSECADIGHTYKQCNSTEKKCLNCDGPHRTLAAVCPIRKEIIKNKREEKKKKKAEFEQNNKTYCAVTRMTSELPKVIQSQKTPQTILQVSDRLSTQIIVIIAEAHFYNLAHPGSFGRRVNQLLQLNNLPTVKLPEDAPSSSIFNIINTAPEYAAPSQEEVVESSESNTSIDIDSGPHATMELPERTHTARKSTTQSTHQKATEDSEKYKLPTKKAHPIQTGKKEPSKSGVILEKIGLKFHTYEQSGIPETLPPNKLYQSVQEGKVKFTYTDERINEWEIIRFIKEGIITTKMSKIQPVEKQIYKKIRSGLVRGTPPEAVGKQKHRLLSS